MRAHSRSELHRALGAKAIPEDIQEELLDRFTELDLVDDRDFAQQWVASRHRTRGASRRALTQELRTKGVEAEVVAEAVATISPDDEVEAAMTLATKKLRSMAGVNDPLVRKRRLAAALARRGFGHEVVSRVVSSLCDEELED